jgi:GNAT superfamily N-acetyltransferase
MKSSDLGFASECAKDVGWKTTTRNDFEASLTYDPNGCFIMEEEGLREGLCVATNYGSFGFVGCLIVVKEMRGRGIGYQLLKHAVEYLYRCDTRNVLLDGVPAAISLYERMGFVRVCQSLRFSGKLQGQRSHAVREIVAEDLKTIIKLDRKAFGADRMFFLEHYWKLYPDLGKVLERDGEIVGFMNEAR